MFNHLDQQEWRGPSVLQEPREDNVIVTTSHVAVTHVQMTFMGGGGPDLTRTVQPVKALDGSANTQGKTEDRQRMFMRCKEVQTHRERQRTAHYDCLFRC